MFSSYQSPAPIQSFYNMTNINSCAQCQIECTILSTCYSYMFLPIVTESTSFSTPCPNDVNRYTLNSNAAIYYVAGFFGFFVLFSICTFCYALCCGRRRREEELQVFFYGIFFSNLQIFPSLTRWNWLRYLACSEQRIIRLYRR
jgi:hypothetical protein